MTRINHSLAVRAALVRHARLGLQLTMRQNGQNWLSRQALVLYAEQLRGTAITQ